jgi:hypothetical protein
VFLTGSRLSSSQSLQRQALASSQAQAQNREDFELAKQILELEIRKLEHEKNKQAFKMQQRRENALETGSERVPSPTNL